MAEPLRDLIRRIWAERRSGTVTLPRGDRFLFVEGELFLPRTTPVAGRVGEYLTSWSKERTDGAPPQADPSMARLVEGLLEELLASAETGRHSFEAERLPAPDDRVGPLPTPLLVMELAVRGLSDPELVAVLGGGAAEVQAVPDAPSLGRLPPLDTGTADLLGSLAEPCGLRALLERAREPDRALRQLGRLHALGLVRVLPAPEGDGEALLADSTSRVSTALLHRFLERIGASLDEQPPKMTVASQRARVGELLATAGNLDHYQLLDVGADPDPGELATAFREIARTVHPSGARRLGLTGRERVLELLFERATEAYLTLSDPLRRSDYNVAMGIKPERKRSAAQLQREREAQAKDRYRRAVAYLQEEDFHFASELLKEAVRLDPRAEYWAALGEVQARNPRWLRHAVESFRHAVHQRPEEAAWRVKLGAVYERLGNLEEATRCYRGALERVPGFAEAATALGRLGMQHSQQETGPWGWFWKWIQEAR